jgi:hypothetical protein
MHPFLSAFLSLFLADFLTRLFFSPKDPFYIPTIKKTGRRLFLQVPILFGILVETTPVPLPHVRTTLIIAVYFGAYVLNQIFWQRVSAGHARLRSTFIVLIGFMLATAFLISCSQFRAIIPIHMGSTTKWHILVGTTVYLCTIFGGGRLIRTWTKPLAVPAPSPETPAQLQNAGLYIGWLERFLAVTAISIQAPALVGLILTAKALARFPEFKEPRFAEYFLIGTLLSLALATIGGLIIARMLYGTFSLK